MPSPPLANPRCGHCGAATLCLTCTCRGCVDPVWACDCTEDTADLLERDGVCPGCAVAGCQQGLADFVRCLRLPPR